MSSTKSISFDILNEYQNRLLKDPQMNATFLSKMNIFNFYFFTENCPANTKLFNMWKVSFRRFE